MRPIVSVIVPAYNSEQDIARCLQSLVEQTLSPIEIIVVNDGSIDGTGHIVESYINQYPFVTLITQTNQGVGAARNAALKQATGNYIGFVDADDTVDARFLEKLYDRARTTQADCIICNYKQTHKKVDLFEAACFEVNEITRATGYIRYIAKYPVLWNKLYKREILKNLTFDTTMKMGEDLLFNTQAYEKMGRIAVVEEVLYNYNDTQTSLTRTRQQGQYRNMLRSYCEDEGLVTEGDLAVYQGLVFLTGFLFSTVMNGRDYKYVRQEVHYLLQHRKIVFREFVKNNHYIEIVKYDTISMKMYLAYKVVFGLIAWKMTGIGATVLWLLSKMIRMRHYV